MPIPMLKSTLFCPFCNEEIHATVKEVLTFETVKCPACASEVYYTEEQQLEASDYGKLK